MVRTDVQDAVCRFVRDILSARTGGPIRVVGWPDITNRTDAAVEELWESASRRYAIEHTRLESYAGQMENEARLRKLIQPVREQLRGRLPGSHVLTVRVSETQSARIKFEDAHKEIVALALATAPQMTDGQTLLLPSTVLPFTVQLHRRSGRGSHVAVYCVIDGDAEELRVQRMRRALDDKCPKLAKWTSDERKSVLALEANDIQLSNVTLAFSAFIRAIQGRADQPDIVVFVETDIVPMMAWMFKENEQFGDGIPMPGGGRSYTDGEVRSST